MTAQLQVRALDALTGEVIWNFDPYKGIAVCRAKGVNRGVTYWSDGEHRRIFVSAGPYMHCLDASTGKLVADCAEGGVLDMTKDVGRDIANTRLTHHLHP